MARREPRPPEAVRLARGTFGIPHNLEAKIADHLVVRIRRLALRRQIIAHEDRVRSVEAECLHTAKMELAPTSDPYFTVRVHEAKHRQHLEAIPWVQIIAACQRRAFDRIEKVYRNR